MARDTVVTFSLRFYRKMGTLAKLPLADKSAAIGLSSTEAAEEWFSVMDREERRGEPLPPK